MSYLVVVVDCMSHYPELRQMKGKTANHVVMALKFIYGVPMLVFADNMPFSSQQMLAFAKGFTCVFSLLQKLISRWIMNV